MKTRWNKRLSTMLLIGALAGMTPQLALAAGTAVCTEIINSATLSYSVDLVAQDDKTHATPFDVANKVLVTVVTVDGANVQVTPGGAEDSAWLTFTVTNEGNAIQDYILTGVPLPGLPGPFGGTDTFDVNGIKVVVEDGTNPGVYNPLEDTALYINDLAPDASATVYLVVTGTPAIALGQMSNDIAAYYLLADTYDSDDNGAGTNETTEGTTTGACSAPNVLADTVNGTDDLINRGGDDSDRSAFVVASALISIVKSVGAIWDPINYNTAPKAIPGALVQYAITIRNFVTATSSATLTTISDTLVATLLMDPDLLTDFTVPATPAAESVAGSGFKAIVTGSTRVGSGSGLVNNTDTYYTTVGSADGIDLAAPTITATLATVLDADTGGGTPYIAGELKPGETLTITFNAVVQ